MRLTPLDIKKQDFKRTMRGLDPDEVQAFLQMLAEQWQELVEENSRLDRSIVELESKLTHYKQVEEAMQEALKTARQTSKQTLDAAKAKSKAIVEEAVAAAMRIQKKAEDEKYSLRREIESIRSRRTEVIARLRALLGSEIAILDDHEARFPTLPEDETTDELESTDFASQLVDVSEEEAVAAMEEIEESVDGQDGPEEPERQQVANNAESESQVATQGSAEAQAAASADTLHFESSTPEPAGNHVEPPLGAREDQPEVRHNSPEMDKIRKILDDLA